MNRNARGTGIGTVSLVMIFAVLCLTVFATLTLSASNAEKALSDKTSTFVKGYYEADSLATKVSAELCASYENGVLPEFAHDVGISYEQDGAATIASFSCRVTEMQDLLVSLRLEKGLVSVLNWKTWYSQSWEADNSITVWDGGGFDPD